MSTIHVSETTETSKNFDLELETSQEKQGPAVTLCPHTISLITMFMLIMKVFVLIATLYLIFYKSTKSKTSINDI